MQLSPCACRQSGTGQDSATLGVACGQPQVQAAASELLVMVGINVQFCFHSKGKAYKGSSLAIGDTVLVLRKYFTFSPDSAEGLHPAQVRLLCVSFLELDSTAGLSHES